MKGMMGKAYELGWSPNLTEEERRMAFEKPKFVYVRFGQMWGPWKKGKRGNDGGFIVSWGAEKIGFGEMTFVIKGGRMICDTEMMGKEFTTAAVLHLLKNTVFDPKPK